MLKDSDGKKSLTATLFVIGFLAATIKLLVGGLTIVGVTMAPFSGVEYGACLAALGGIYVVRRKNEKDTK